MLTIIKFTTGFFKIEEPEAGKCGFKWIYNTFRTYDIEEDED